MKRLSVGKQYLFAFSRAFLQVLLVSLNTLFIVHERVALMFITSLAINYIWTHNVKGLSLSTEGIRLTYTTGAAFGCLSGYYINKLF